MSTCAAVRPRPETADQHRTRSIVGVVVIVSACVAVEVVSGLVTAGPVRSWYPDLSKPSWTPPDWVFGPVWTALYGMMAVAASRVWLARDRWEVCCPLAAFGVQLAANLAWSVLFFGLRSPALGLVDVLLLCVLVGVTAGQFFGVSRSAGWLMLPYLGWVLFAAALNASIVLRAA